jgi:hypothetical protein
MPLSARRGKDATAAAAAIVHANAPQSEVSGRRPYLLKMLQHHIGSYLLADTLDWDGEFFVIFFLSFSRPRPFPPPWLLLRGAREGEI